jgi:[glutamine synthetase] adenylyltransferase / [glutamine synthetase]-adenylyl-L-tyrosine phosphorylase
MSGSSRPEAGEGGTRRPEASQHGTSRAVSGEGETSRALGSEGGSSPWTQKLSAQCWDPQLAGEILARLAEFSPDLETLCRRSPREGVDLLNFLCFSPVSLEKICRSPDLLLWLVAPDVLDFQKAERQGRDREEPDPDFKSLRAWKSQESLRVAFREITGLAGFVETTRDITEIAERCVRQVYRASLTALSNRWGAPQTGFGVLGMGKLGGRELNYSSDIDLIFLYGEEGFVNPRFSYHEFFTRLAEKIVSEFAERGNALFRIDLRLRPEGSSGPLVRGLASTENYYAGYGETWERMALIKARGIAGDQELLYEFEHHLQPFIFPKAVSDELLTEIAALKERIERDLLGADDLYRNVKLGFGGIREVEFIVQTLQVLHGARHAFLQERNTLEALSALAELEIMPAKEVNALRSAYVFLRAVEHRLQIVREQQTHTLPAKTEDRFLLAKSLGLDSVEAFDQQYGEQTFTVRVIFDRLLQSRSGEVAEKRGREFFSHSIEANRTLERLQAGPSDMHVSARTRRLYSKLEPELLGWLAQMADPDAALGRFVRFVDNYGIRGLLFETLLANPRLLELLVRLFDASAAFSDLAIRRPELIEEIARGRSLNATTSATDYLAALQANPENLPPLEWVRAFRESEVLRILLRDILGTAPLDELQAEMTNLADACVRFCQGNIPGADLLTIVALGKFGGQELLYGADLDVVFIGEQPAPAGRLIAALSATTNAGRVFPIDTRLRPEGDNGMLVVTLSGYESYFTGRAQTWEQQALTKARVISGPESQEVENQIAKIWDRLRTRPNTKAEIAGMYERIVKARAKSGDWYEFKTGRGGLIGIEFLVQSLEIKLGVREPNTLKALEHVGDQLDKNEPETLASDYVFYRRIESILRRVNNQSVSSIPSQEPEQKKLALRMGFPDRDTFLHDYRLRRGRDNKIVQQHFYGG